MEVQNQNLKKGSQYMNSILILKCVNGIIVFFSFNFLKSFYFKIVLFEQKCMFL